MDHDDTLAATEAPSGSAVRTTQPERPAPVGDSYTLGDVIGRGGMGEVIQAHDLRIGRDVAIKRMQSGDLARFVREAKIQARLDHPAIVPVYELGTDAQGQPFFTMKRLAGTTLAAVIDEASQQRLLRALVDVARAIELAHSRRVVHRDLKPTNIMLGDYGEVYVLDWGVARELDVTEPERAGATTSSGGTQIGAVLGTPGYMAPEQVRGAADVGPPTDIYALGAILFEILAGEALHPPGKAGLDSTLAARDPSPAKRRPERAVPPELDALCVDALVTDPAARPTARQLADRIQQFLDGDRDVVRRKQLAAVQLSRALAAFAVDDRAVAMQAAGHALALDPESEAAAQLVTSLMLEPPKVLPPELAAQLATRDAEFGRHQWRLVVSAFLALVVFLPFLAYQGILDWRPFAACYGLVGVLIVLAMRYARGTTLTLGVPLALNVVMVVLMSRWLGPYIFVPGVLCIQVLSFVSYPEYLARPWLPITLMSLPPILVVVLEATHVLAPTSRVVGDTLVTTSRVLDIAGPITTPLLVIGTVSLVVVCGLFASGLARGRADAQRKLEIQSWHLRKLLPV